MNRTRTPKCRQSVKAIVWSLCLVATSQGLQAAAAAQPPATSVAGAVKEKSKAGSEDPSSAGSVFFDDFNNSTKFGSDIFFPSTKRFARKVESKNPAGPVRSETPALSQVVLKGISGSGDRRLAVINNRTVARGETLEIKHNGQSYRVKCDQIKARSVILSIEGLNEKKEIQLREGL